MSLGSMVVIGSLGHSGVSPQTFLSQSAGDIFRQPPTEGHETFFTIKADTALHCGIVHCIYLLEELGCHVQVLTVKWSCSLTSTTEKLEIFYKLSNAGKKTGRRLLSG